MLFADIVSSTALYEELGDAEARRVVGQRLDGLSGKVAQFSGSVVKSLGDGLLCSFGSEEEAVWAALEMCARGSDPLEVRVGLHVGEVIAEAGDIFGDAVNTASRIVALARPSEILISRSMQDALPPMLQKMARRVPPVSVKGKREPLHLFAILPPDLNTSIAAAQTINLFETIRVSRERATAVTALDASYDGRRYALGTSGELTIGRDPVRDIVADNPHVSRLHARVFYRQGKFVLADQSANGTYLVPEGLPKLHLLREETLLSGGGCIYLGADPDTMPTQAIFFEIV